MQQLFRYAKDLTRKLEESGYQGLSGRERVFITVWEATAAISKDGFEKFYSSTAGDWAAEAPAAFRAIGAARAAAIVEEANAVFGPDGPSANDEQRYRQIARLGEEAGNLLYAQRERFNAKPDNILFLLMDYLEAPAAPLE